MNEFTALMIFLLMPGILGILILDALVEHKPWSPFLYTLYAIVFGVAVYLVEQLAVWSYLLLPLQRSAAVPGESSLSVWRYLSGGDAEFNLAEIMWGTLIAIPLAVLSAMVVNKKWLNRIAQSLGVSTKYGEENLFSYFLNSGDVSWVWVRDIERDLTYQGLVYSCSEAGNMQELVLQDVTVFGSTDAKELYKLPSVYLAKELGGFTIEAIPNERWKEANHG